MKDNFPAMFAAIRSYCPAICLGMTLLLAGHLLLNFAHCQRLAKTPHRAHAPVLLAVITDSSPVAPADGLPDCDSVCHGCVFLTLQEKISPDCRSIVPVDRVSDETCPDGPFRAIDKPPQRA